MLKPRYIIFIVTVFIYLSFKIIPYVFKVQIEAYNIPMYVWGLSPELALGMYCGIFVRGGSILRGSLMALAPLFLRIVADAAVTFITGDIRFLVYDTQLAVYGCLFLGVGLGALIKNQRNIFTVFGTATLMSAAFFLVTNAVIWGYGDRALYPYSRDISGLLTCYAMALPFAKYNIISTLIFSQLLISPLGIREVVLPEYSAETLPVEKGSLQSI